MKYYLEEKEQVLQEVESSEKGLSSEEASSRLAKNGKNKLAEAKGKPIIVRFFEQMMDPMIIILLAAALVSGILAGV